MMIIIIVIPILIAYNRCKNNICESASGGFTLWCFFHVSKVCIIISLNLIYNAVAPCVGHLLILLISPSLSLSDTSRYRQKVNVWSENSNCVSIYLERKISNFREFQRQFLFKSVHISLLIFHACTTGYSSILVISK